MPRMSKKLKHEWSLFLNHRGRRCYNSLCRRCIHSCLMHSKGFPIIQIGKRMVVPKDKLLAWMEEQSAA